MSAWFVVRGCKGSSQTIVAARLGARTTLIASSGQDSLSKTRAHHMAPIMARAGEEHRR